MYVLLSLGQHDRRKALNEVVTNVFAMQANTTDTMQNGAAPGPRPKQTPSVVSPLSLSLQESDFILVTVA